jgi:predicted nucleic acid-binding protein
MPTGADPEPGTAMAVPDAPAIVTLLTDDGPAGAWTAGRLAGMTLVAPALLPFQVANVFRRLERAGGIDRTTAAQAHQDLLDLRLTVCPYVPLAPRIWELRGSVTAYDAASVALAEFDRRHPGHG